MRVTDWMIRSNILYDVQSTLRRIDKYHRSLSSGKKVIYPSDDAVIATRASNIQSRMREIEQYKRNVDHVKSIVNSYDSIVQEVSGVYHRIRELLVMAANDTLTDDEREAIAKELEGIMDHLAEIANTKIGGEYIFGGVRTDKPPVEKINGEWRITLPREADRKRVLNMLGVEFEYGITVNDLFRTDMGEDVFQILRDTVDKLRGNDPDTSEYISKVALSDISYMESRVMKNFAHIGAAERSLELVSKRLMDLDSFFVEYLSSEQDADITEVVTKLSMQNAVLEAALKSGAMVLGKTLVDFV